MLGLNSRVNYHGEVTTIRALAERGLISFNVSAHYGKRDITAYFADISNDGDGWQISELAYNSGKSQYPNSSAEQKPVMPSTFAEYQAAIRAKLTGSGAEWLVDVDYPNWEQARGWLMTAPLSDIVAYAPIIESESWDGSIPCNKAH